MAYSDAERSEALVRLAVNKYDYAKTAEQTGILVRTLRRWDKNVPKKGVSALLERAIERLLMVIPENMKGQDWAIALGILLDKWLLIQGLPTQRIEDIQKRIGAMGQGDIDAVLAEAERILAETAGGGVVGSNCDPGNNGHMA